jgi:hypothetical protein
MTVLDRAKAAQLKVASDTVFWCKLDLFEAMIAEIERLQAYEKAHPASARSISEIGQRVAGGAP